jgi:hypothetical protein
MSAEVFSVFSVHAAAPNRENRGNHTRDLNGLRPAGQFSRFSRFSRAAYRESDSVLLLIVCMYRLYNYCYFWTFFFIGRGLLSTEKTEKTGKTSGAADVDTREGGMAADVTR